LITDCDIIKQNIEGGGFMVGLKIAVKYKEFEFNVEGEKASVVSIFNDVKKEIIDRLNDQPLNTHHQNSNDKSGNVATEKTAPVAIKKKTSSKTNKVAKSVPAANNRPKFINDIKLDKKKTEDFINEFNQYSPANAEKAVPLLFYLYNKQIGSDSARFNIDTTYTLLRTVAFKKIPKNIPQCLRNIKQRTPYLLKNDDGTYSTSHIVHRIIDDLGGQKINAKSK
jgi:hypothetical protein